jgi:polyhydroxybutyrate depolymerase
MSQAGQNKVEQRKLSRKSYGSVVVVVLLVLGIFVACQVWRKTAFSQISLFSLEELLLKPKTLPLPEKTFTLNSGDYKFSLTHNGEIRSYLLHVPISYQSTRSTPLILAFHGGLGSAEIMRNNYGFVEKSEKEGFLVAFPNGTSRLSSGKMATWNAGNCCGYAVESESDDVGFVKAVIGDIQQKFNVRAVFATGMSNGGMISHRLACETPELFTAIAAVAGTNNFPNCVPAMSISILHIHSLKDNHVLFNGGCGPGCISNSETEHVSVSSTMEEWVALNHCDTTPIRAEINENAYSETYSGCDGNSKVKLIVTKDGGHSWPSASFTANQLEKNSPSQAISATDEVWAFFEQVMVRVK